MEATPRYQPQRHGHPPTLRSQCWWRPKSASASVPSRVAPCFVKVCTTRPIEDEHPLLVAGTYVLARVFVVVLFKEDLIEQGNYVPRRASLTCKRRVVLQSCMVISPRKKGVDTEFCNLHTHDGCCTFFTVS